jgi:transcriptional regulator with XRE-family HTH domain
MGNRLRVIRAEKRVTQFRLSIATGVIQSRLSQMENDLINPSPEEKEKIAGALGVQVGEIWTEGNINSDSERR